MLNNRHCAATLAIWAGLVLHPPLSIQAQDLRASLTGLVRDPSGAIVPTATVKAKNLATEGISTATTNAAGSYSLLFLTPGRYSVTVESPGFKQFVRENLVLSTAERGTLDVALQVGQVDDRVTVTAEAPLLETGTASRSSVVDGKQMTDLPNNARNIYNVILALPSVQKHDGRWGAFSAWGLVNSTRISINGGIARDNETVLDGVVNTQADRTVVFQPPLEAVAEVNLQTSTFDASYGRFGGGVVAINTKSGTNALHGTIFEQYTTSALAANGWSNNFNGQKRPEGRQHQFGAEVDGPIVIPKLLNGRNRLFFMMSYEAHRRTTGGNLTSVVPAPELRTGDFSSVPRLVYDPLTTRVANGQVVRSPFAGNRIPSNRLNPVSQNIVKFFPAPNLPPRGYGIANYLNDSDTSASYNLFLGRLDFRIDDRNSIYFSLGKMPYREVGQVLFPNSPADVSTENPLYRYFDRAVFDWTRTLTASTVLNFRAGYVRYGERSGNPLAVGFDSRTLGIDTALVAQQRIVQFPRFVTGGFYASLGSPSPLNRGANDTQSYQLNINRTQGRHQMKTGVEFRIYNQNRQNSGFAAGLYQFNRGFTQADPTRADVASGEELASLLLGYPAGGQVDLAIDPALQSSYYTVFAQDDIRVSSRLSLNLGLRWDYETPARERYNRMVRGFAYDVPNPLASRVPGLKGGLLYAGADGDQRYAFNPDRNNIQPRIGVAFKLTRNLVVRGGYGLYYTATFGGQPTTGFSASTPLESSADAGFTPRVNLVNAFPGRLTQPVGNSLGLSTNLGQAIDFNYLDRGTPSAHQISFGLQHLLPLGMVAEATYSSNRTRNYPVDVDLNSIPREQLGQPVTFYTAQVSNPLAGLLPLNPARNGSTVPRQNLLVPFPQHTTVMMRNIPLGRNDYHALQTRLAMRYRHGMTMSVAYTWSKTLEQRSFQNPQDFNLQNVEASKLERRLAEFDLPHRLTALWSYELPFGKNRLIGRKVGGFVDRLISGWQVNVIASYQSGFPVAFPNAPNLEARSAKLTGDRRNVFNAFDKTLFPTTAPNLQYTYRTWPTRFPDVRLGSLRNTDMGLSKKTRITEKILFDFRAEAYNVSNTPWFSSLNARGTDVTRPEFGWFNFNSSTALAAEGKRGVTLIGKLVW